MNHTTEKISAEDSEQYRTVVLLGESNVGKSTIAGRLISYSLSVRKQLCVSEPGQDESLSNEGEHSMYREMCDVVQSERENKSSEMTCYRSLEDSSGETEIVVCPGRRKFWKWLDYGCADADFALVVVRVKEESGDLQISELIEPVGHCLSMGVRLAGIVVNDCDSLGKEKISACRVAVEDDLRRFFTEIPPIHVFSPKQECTTHLLSCVMSLPVPQRNADSAFELSINSIFDRGDSVILGGKVRKGQIRIGDVVYLMPGRLKLRIASIQISKGRGVDVASAGRVVAVRVEGVSKNQVSTGMALVGDISIGKETRLLRAKMSFFNAKHAIRIGFSPVVSILACQAHAKITEIDGGASISLGETVNVTVALAKTVFAQTSGSFSRIVFRQANCVIAVGVISEILHS